jgi:hypothetical protein
LGPHSVLHLFLAVATTAEGCSLPLRIAGR